MQIQLTPVLSSLNDSLKSKIEVKYITVTSPELQGGVHTNLNLSFPSGAVPAGKVMVVPIIISTPNNAWVFANVQTWDNASVIVGVYNSASSAITGNFYFALLLKDAN